MHRTTVAYATYPHLFLITHLNQPQLVIGMPFTAHVWLVSSTRALGIADFNIETSGMVALVSLHTATLKFCGR